MTRTEELNRLLNICFERLNSWKESFWIIYQISCRQDCVVLEKHHLKRLFHSIHTDEDFIDIKCLVPILRTFGNIISMDSSGCAANEFITGLQNYGVVIRHILINNRHVNLNDECAWLLGNVFNVLKITNLNENGSFIVDNFKEICNYFFI